MIEDTIRAIGDELGPDWFSFYDRPNERVTFTETATERTSTVTAEFLQDNPNNAASVAEVIRSGAAVPA